MVQLTSILLMITGKTITLAIQSFVSKVMSLFFNMVSRFVTSFLPRSKCPLISWLQSPSAEILEPKKIKSIIVSTFHYFPIYLLLFPLYPYLSGEIMDWIKHKLESRLPGEISISDMQMTPSLWQKAKRNYRAS